MTTNITKMIETFALTDFGVKIDVTENPFKNGISSFNYIFDGITYSYSSPHLNINVIVSDIMKALTHENIETFQMKIRDYDKLRSITYDVFSEKFDHCTWSLGDTWYSPFNNQYEIEVILQGKKLKYTHAGSIETIEYKTIGNYFLNTYPEYSI